MRDAIRVKHYSYRTEETYVQWIRRYILLHNKRHSKDRDFPEIDTHGLNRSGQGVRSPLDG